MNAAKVEGLRYGSDDTAVRVDRIDIRDTGMPTAFYALSRNDRKQSAGFLPLNKEPIDFIPKGVEVVSDDVFFCTWAEDKWDRLSRLCTEERYVDAGNMHTLSESVRKLGYALGEQVLADKGYGSRAVCTVPAVVVEMREGGSVAVLSAYAYAAYIPVGAGFSA